MSAAPEAGVPVGPIIGWKRWPAVGAWPLHVYGEVDAKLVRLSELPSAAGIHRFWEPDPATYTPEILTQGTPILPEEAGPGCSAWVSGDAQWVPWEELPQDARANPAWSTWLRPHASKAAPVVDAEHPPEGYRLGKIGERRTKGYLWFGVDEKLRDAWLPGSTSSVGARIESGSVPIAIPLDPAPRPPTNPVDYWVREEAPADPHPPTRHCDCAECREALSDAPALVEERDYCQRKLSPEAEISVLRIQLETERSRVRDLNAWCTSKEEVARRALARANRAESMLDRVRSEFSSRTYAEFLPIQGAVEEFLDALDEDEPAPDTAPNPRKRIEAAEARVKELEAAIRWALGEGDSDFPGDYHGRGQFGWRVKLRALSKLEGRKG